MTLPPGLPERVRTLFIEELTEHSASMARRLEELAAPGAGVLDESEGRELLRSAHSLKGAARAAGFGELESLCHALESALLAWRGRPGPPGPALIAAIRGGVARLEAAADALREARPVDDAGLRDAARVLEEAADVPAPAAGPPVRRAPPPRAPMPGPARPTEAAAAVLRLPAGHLDALLDQAGEVLVAARAIGGVAREVEDALDAFVAGGARRQHRGPRRARGISRAGGSAPDVVDEADRAWEEASALVGRVAVAVRSGHRVLREAAATLQVEAQQAGLLPFEVACAGLDAVARQTAAACGKNARLVIAGEALRIDRVLVGALREPLIQLVRNAVVHGVEEPDARRRSGKPDPATISVVAELRGIEVSVGVHDDGAGIDGDRVRRAAAELGMAVDTDLAELLFTSGLSTASAATLESGRGVGLDVVRSGIEGLGGSVTIASEVGAGTRVDLVMPSHTATQRVLVAQLAGQQVALPLTAARRVVAVDPADLRLREGGAVLSLADRTVPVVDLAATLPRPAGSQRATATAVVVESGGEWAALLVDTVLTEEEVIVRPPGERLAGAPLIIGVAALPGGDLVTVLNPAACVRHGRGRQAMSDLAIHDSQIARRVLLVEDSVTTRALERGILEGAGYVVLPTPDGAEAWALLTREDVDLVVADVNMPGMDGLELCRRIRASGRLGNLPVVLVTTLDSEEDRSRGVDAGADAYITKASFDQGSLLDTLARLL